MLNGIQVENSKNEKSKENLGYIYFIQRLYQGEQTCRSAEAWFGVTFLR